MKLKIWFYVSSADIVVYDIAHSITNDGIFLDEGGYPICSIDKAFLSEEQCIKITNLVNKL
jgi:hypothetical protein